MFKEGIDKSFRRSIHAGLIAEVNRLQNEVSVFIDKDLPPIHSESKAELIDCLTDCIRALKSETPEDINQTFDKAADAILSFTPAADKFLHGIAMGIGLLAAVACFFSALAGTRGKQDDQAENSRNTVSKIIKIYWSSVDIERMEVLT